jgi:hypothetical protein
MSVLVPHHFRIHQAIQTFESVSEANPTRYYLFIAKSYSLANSTPLTGNVKTSTSSNTVVGRGTYFTSELAVGDTIGFTNQTQFVRVHAIPTAQTLIVTPRPSGSNTTGANAYLRKLFSEQNPPPVEDTYQNTYYDLWRNMISLKKAQTSDVSHVVTRYNWSNNHYYDIYDDQDEAIHLQEFYTFTDPEYNVYKCIDNNRGANSTVKPTGTDPSSIINTADGYRWKYMYTITAGEILKFRSADYIPVKTLKADDGSAQWSVQTNAANGAIHHVKVIANGSGYLSTNGLFSSITNAVAFTLRNVSIQPDSEWVGSGLYISEGAAAGEYRKIIRYHAANNMVVVNSAFSTTPNTASRYNISPLVTIRGDSGGTTTSRATAYVSNTQGGQVRYVKIINQGRSYSTANVTISAKTGFGATARPIISPRGGHGSDPVDELHSSSVMMNFKTTGSESNTFPTNNDFRIIGVVRDPLLANGSVANTSVIDQTTRIGVNFATGDFTGDEVILGQKSGAKARLVYFANTNDARTEGTLKMIRVTTNGIGKGFETNELVVGQTSGISANVVSVTKPALKLFSGAVIYTEIRDPVFRSPAQSEDYKITISY